jgi:hypothetical protein
MIDKIKDWGNLATRWIILFAIVVIAWTNLENRVTRLEADTMGIPEMLLSIKEDLAAIKTDISWLKENMPKNDN